MGAYNSTSDFPKVEESTNKKNNHYYFGERSVTKIPISFYKYQYCWGMYTYPLSIEYDDIYKTYLFL